MIEHRQAMLWLDMGLGKTVATLTTILEQRNRMEVWGTLIVAPLRVVQAVWRQEARKWAHTDGQFKFSMVIGNKEQRERALFTKADVYLTNFESLPWLLLELERRWLSKGRYLPFNQIVWDEISKMKNTRVQQGVTRGIAALKMLPYITHRIGLTGTPAGKGLLDLFGQYLCVDDGLRLGTSFDAYKRRYFDPDPDDWHQRRWILRPGAEAEIMSRVSDITISMRSDDYLDLPPLLLNDIYVGLTPKLQRQYKDMEKELLLSFDSGHELEIDSAASLVNRCLQFANGACYKAPGSPEWENIHDLKLDALSDVVDEAAGKPILIMYEFQHDAEKIMKKYPEARRISSQLPEAEFNDTIVKWNQGLLPMLIGHPASIGHGLNIQAGSNLMVWYGLNWSLELYSQAMARLRRQGQKLPVIAHRIMTRYTFDEVVRLRLASNEETEHSMRNAIEQYRRGQ
jgi:SNF2 family DNA or RNA helicase